MPTLRCSRYTFQIPLQRGRVLAWNSLSGGLAVWEASEREMYERAERSEVLPGDDPAVLGLLRGGYLVRPEVDELAALGAQYNAHRFDSKTLILTIAPTLSCNFGCDYCFQGQDKPSETMGQQVQDAIVRYIEGAIAGGTTRVHIAWYGGEPLLRRQIIYALSDRIIPICDAAGVAYDAMIVTNGYLLSAEVAQDLVDRRVKMAQVTLDGDEAHHDERRTLLSGGATFDRILQNLVSVAGHVPLPINVRVNIDDRNADEVRGLVHKLHALGLGVQKRFALYFAPVEALTVGCHSVEEVTMSKGDYGRLEAELVRLAFDHGLTGLPYPPRFHGTCAAVRPSGLVVTPTGALHKCWDTVTYSQHAIGSIFDPESAQSRLAQKWITWTPFQNETCRNCKLLPSCGGACAYKFLHAKDTRGQAAVLPCPSWKYNLVERLLLRAEKSGAITADDILVTTTDPSDLCTDDHLPGGIPLPEAMAAAYAAT